MTQSPLNVSLPNIATIAIQLLHESWGGVRQSIFVGVGDTGLPSSSDVKAQAKYDLP